MWLQGYRAGAGHPLHVCWRRNARAGRGFRRSGVPVVELVETSRSVTPEEISTSSISGPVVELVETSPTSYSPELSTNIASPNPVTSHIHHAAPMAYVYILECGDRSFYVGSTVNLELRLMQHQAGEGCTYTAKRQPVRLVFSEYFTRVDEAFAREKQVQGWSRAKRLALIEGRMHDLPALSASKSCGD
jgi:putative endonuclease